MYYHHLLLSLLIVDSFRAIHGAYMQDEGNNGYFRSKDLVNNHRNDEDSITFPDHQNDYVHHYHNCRHNHCSGSSGFADLKNGQRKLAEDVENVKNSLIGVQDSYRFNLQSIQTSFHQKLEDCMTFLNDEICGIRNDVDDQKKRNVMLEVNQNKSDAKLADLKFKLDAEIHVQNNKSLELEVNLKNLMEGVDQINKTCQCEEKQINLVKQVYDVKNKIYEMKSTHDRLEANQNSLNEYMFNIKNSLERELVALKNNLDEELVELVDPKNKVNNKLNNELIRLTNKDAQLESLLLQLQGKIKDLNDVIINLKDFQVNNWNEELESPLIV